MLARKHGIPVGVFAGVLNTFWHKRAYNWVWISTDSDKRHRVLVAVKYLAKRLKYYFCQAENDGTIETLFNRLLHPFVCFPPHFYLKDILTSVQSGYSATYGPRAGCVLRGRTKVIYVEIATSLWTLVKEFLDLFLRFRISNEPTIFHHMFLV